MRWLRTGLVVAAGATVARAATHRNGPRDDRPRWLSVTVHAEPDRVREYPRLGEAFARLGPDVETRVLAAPGGKGTEIGALPRSALWSLCDKSNTNPGIGSALFGYEPGAVYGYSHAMGGYRGSHAEYVRVPFADHGAFPCRRGSTT